MYKMTLDGKGDYVDGVKIETPDEVRCIPLSMQNRDCVDFLIAWRDGDTLLDQFDVPVPYSIPAVQALGLEPPP